MDLPKSTKLLIGTVIIVGSLSAITFFATSKNDPKNEIETYLGDSPITENKIEDINAIKDEDERLNALEGNLQTASRTISVEDENNLLSKNMLEAIPTSEELELKTLYITFDKTIENVEKERKRIIKYSEDKGSLPIKVIYLNVESSHISGSNLISELTGDEGFKVPPAAFVVEKSKIIWQDSTYKNLPLRGDI